MCPFISFEYVVAECSDLHASSSRQEEAKQADSEDAKELRAEPCIFACQAKKSSLQQPWKISTWGTPFQNDKRFGSQWCYSESLASNKPFCLVGHRRENVGTRMHFHFGEQMDSSNFLIEKATSPNALGEKHVSFSRPWILSWVSGRQRNSASHDRRFPGISWKHAIDRLIAWQVRS